MPGKGHDAAAARTLADREEPRVLDFALNHITVARASYAGLLDIAARLGCVGVEARNDLDRPLFDRMEPAEAGAMARDKGLRLLSVAEVPGFTAMDEDIRAKARHLIDIAAAAGAEAVSLIPRNDNRGRGEGERQANLRAALRELRPMLNDAGLVGLVEPLGFATSALCLKAETVAVIDELGAGGTFRIVHDTFHHHLAGGGPIFAGRTGIVHVSGVANPDLDRSEMADADRILVDRRDRLRSVDQIAALLAGGYAGPVSFESFAKEVHAVADPAAALGASMDFIRSQVTAHAA